MSRVLIVEDQPAVAHALEVLFALHEIPCEVAPSPAEALPRVASGEIGVVIQDMNFSRSATSGVEGIALFRAVRRLDPQMPVLLMTAWTSLETAVSLVREGATDYLAKPWDDDKLLASVRNLLQLRALQAENLRLKRERSVSRFAIARQYDLLGIVYESDAMHRVVSLAVQVAASDVPILVTGPNGAGKEKIAEIVQANSRRRDKPFLRMNVGALPDELLESELFGAEPGAYTGSRRLRIGRFEAADGGTLFLDEIGNLSPAGQVKMLRVLQNKEFERLGSNLPRRADVRVICATNTDLKQAIAEGRFREDLYFRLNVIELAVPPLTERRDDILPLAESVLAELSEDRAGEPLTLAHDAKEALLSHSWPGNVRELFNRIQRAAVVAPHATLTPADLGFGDATEVPAAALSGGGGEKGAVEAVLRRHDGSVSRAAHELGLSRQAFYRKMERLGIILERRPRE
ncbi:MAG TPA: sigma-54 dependent transcriptional regulator [Thermoanaerobaculia bacterium]|nr:sigma-54 dependent transcriptional regulator [Thermoanaerobaculia bacterium]